MGLVVKTGEELQMPVRFPTSVGVTGDDDPIERDETRARRCLKPVPVEMVNAMCPDHGSA